jgi:TIR domain
MVAPVFDVFLSHNSADKPAVEELAHRLKGAGFEPWLDKWHLSPGVPWQNEIEKALANSASCAVFLGPSGINRWQMEEMRAAISQRVQVGADAFRVIPVLLPGTDKTRRSEVPPFLRAGTWVEFVNTLDNEEAFSRLIAGIRGRAPGQPPDVSTLAGRCPYKGLQSFDVDDAPFFCGREALIELVLSKLWLTLTRENSLRFLAIVGASGSGKTSLARAGLVASIRRGALPNSLAWPCLVFRPGANPLESLAKAICVELRAKSSSAARQRLVDPAAVKQLVESLHGPDHDALDLEVSLELGTEQPGRRVIVLVDQFEEIFTIAVGMPITGHPPHRSGQARFEHPAPTLGV